MNDMHHLNSDLDIHSAPADKIFYELSLYKMMVNASLDSITLIDREYTYRIVTDAYLNARQLDRKQIVNHTVAEVWGQEVFVQKIKPKLDECFTGKTVTYRASFEFKQNETNYIESIFTPCFTSNAEVAYVAVISRNMTELKKSQERIAFLAYYDSLTNLPSRPLFLELLRREINTARRTDRSVAVFFFDLDEFKKINDTFGHSAGDKLLVSVGKRLKKYLRRSDIVGRVSETNSENRVNKQNYLARIGGDEFTFIIPDIADKKITTAIAERIIHLFQEPFQVIDREIFISTSIGIALYPDDGGDVETLLKNADTAMYKAKEVGKNTFRYYSSDMNEKARERLKLENKLRYAIRNQEFQLYYQPQYTIANNQMVGMEALIRWEDCEFGFVAPTSLIELAEETGMIIDIGEWAIHAACRQGKLWHDSGHRHLNMAVNLSVRQFFDIDLVKKIKAAIRTTGFNPSFLELEVTETAMMYDTDRAIQVVQAIKALGVKVSLDDFGTGFSSLIHLKLFPIDKLKIDQVFIQNANLHNRDAAIISAIIDLCHQLKIEAVAEGVETTECLAFLKGKKCHLAQGYIFSPPLPPNEIDLLLRTHQPMASCQPESVKPVPHHFAATAGTSG